MSLTSSQDRGVLSIVSERSVGGRIAAAREAYAAETPRVEWREGQVGAQSALAHPRGLAWH